LDRVVNNVRFLVLPWVKVRHLASVILSEGLKRLALQRHFKGFPFFEFIDAAFTMGLVGLMVAPCMILDQDQDVAGLAFGLRKTALH
jgi:Domain of unknown function (DUF4338)